MLCAEIQALIAIMRQNSKWALVPGYGYGEDELPEDQLLEEFKILRRNIFLWKDWTTRDPLTYLGPFLEVIRSVDTSGPITGMALSTLHRVLSQGFFSADTPGAAVAMHQIADAVAHCRFEETDHDADEVVLARILQALLACLRCAAGELLSDDAVCSIVQACFRIGHHTGKEGELLQQMVRQTMHEMVRHLFSRLAGMAPLPPPSLPLSPKTLSTPTSLSVEGNMEGGVGGVGGGGEHALGNGDLGETIVGQPYGLACALEVFQFLVSLVSCEDASSEDLCVFGLTLLNAALDEGREAFAHHAPMLHLVRDDLLRALLAVGTSSNLSVLSFLCTVFLNLYLNLRVYLKLQLEAFLRGIILVLGDGRQVAYEQQRVALEAIVDLCRQPAFMADMYANYDCSLEGGNMFEDICALLSKNAFPVNCPLSAVHLLSLEGLLAINRTVAQRCQAAGSTTEDAEENLHALPEYYDFWEEKIPTGDPAEQAKWLGKRKQVKHIIAAGVEHFNRDPKKGFEYLAVLNLLPHAKDVSAIATFFRRAQGLDKAVLGEFLGDPKEFPVSVLLAYAKSFDFRGMTIDSALRLFLEGFLLPGEAQKISRILEHFAEAFYNTSVSTDGIVADSDSVYVLSYSIIMLNTDSHNKQVSERSLIVAPTFPNVH
jgi:brefeldin A-resistance guanine nucleotide exchange factor 1